MIANFDVKRILMDIESSTDVLLYFIFSQIRLPTDRLIRVSMPLVNFTEDAASVEEKITLPLTAGIEPR